MQKIMKKILIGTLMSAVLCGCGSVSEEEPEDTSTAGTKTYTIATETSFKPFAYTDSEGNFVGLDVELLDAIAKDQGFAYELMPMNFDDAVSAAQSGKADALMAGAQITKERKKSGWIFSDGYYTGSQCLAVKRGSDIGGLEDMEGMTVAVKTGTRGAQYGESLKKDYDLKLLYFEDSDTMYASVDEGQADVCVEDTPILRSVIMDGKYDFDILEDTENADADYAMAVFDEKEQDLIDLFNQGLEDIQASGEYDEIIAKYLG